MVQPGRMVVSLPPLPPLPNTFAAAALVEVPPTTTPPPPSPPPAPAPRRATLMWRKLGLPFNVEKLRVMCIMIGFYHAIIAHFALFLMLMSTMHVKQMVTFLFTDIADHKEREDYYDMPMHMSGVTVNAMRFNSAVQRAMWTRNVIYVVLAWVLMYTLCCALMLIGAIRCRAYLLLPWLLMHTCDMAAIPILCTLFHVGLVDALCGRASLLVFLVVTTLLVEFCFGVVVFKLFCSLTAANKLTKSATVAIPYAKRGEIPYRFCKENMYLGSGGHKHTLSDKSDPNYVV